MSEKIGHHVFRHENPLTIAVRLDRGTGEAREDISGNCNVGGVIQKNSSGRVIPFDFTAKPVVAPPQPPRETVHVKAVRPERDALEIRFPNVTGYRVELPEERLTANFTSDSVLELTPDLIGPTKNRNEGIIGEGIDLTLVHTGDIRKSTLLFNLTVRLLETKWRDPNEEPRTQLFGQLKRIAREWLEHYLVCKGGTYPAQLLFQELADMACERITAGITSAMMGGNSIKAVLDPYNPTGSTIHVNFNTSKTSRWETDSRKCHINWVVLDSDWEAEFCRVAEAHPKVVAYVKNHALGLDVPYRYGSETRRYRPDFIVQIDDGHGPDDLLNLIVEIKGYRGEDAKDKKLTMDTYWIPGVNQLKTYGRWAFVEFTDVYEMQSDFEPILERQFHHLMNYIQGIMHIGQRNIMWVRIGKGAVEKGFSFKHLGVVLHGKLHQEFGAILDKVQVKIYTIQEKVEEVMEIAKHVYHERDLRLGSMTDETEDVFYSCTLCQSFAPSHVCVITPERIGMCGAYNWLDGKASFQINPTGPNQPIEKGECTDEDNGYYAGINEFVKQASRGAVTEVSCYSLMNNPMTACGCFEAIAAMLPQCNGIMVVNRDYMGMTPSGMKFTTLAGMAGGGMQTPGFMGVSKHYMTSKKLFKAEGGIKRVVWIPKILKDEIADKLKEVCADIGMPELFDMIATEEQGTTEEEIMEFLKEKGHPALEMDEAIG